ncbi:MAG: HEPN domain-containing protein [Hyphomicrobiaceae bacterium]
MPFYRRNDLQAIARSKLSDAQLLLQHGRWSNSYYLSGYAVEIGLKACIAKQISADVIPDKNFIAETYRHELRRLVNLAGLSQELGNRERADQPFAANWAIVAQWNPETRYEAIDQFSAQSFLEAVADNATGVFPWIQVYW